MTTQITHCPVGYALGYTPLNGFTPVEDLAVDIANVAQAVSVHGFYMQKSKKAEWIDDQLRWVQV